MHGSEEPILWGGVALLCLQSGEHETYCWQSLRELGKRMTEYDSSANHNFVASQKCMGLCAMRYLCSFNAAEVLCWHVPVVQALHQAAELAGVLDAHTEQDVSTFAS